MVDPWGNIADVNYEDQTNKSETIFDKMTKVLLISAICIAFHFYAKAIVVINKRKIMGLILFN